MFKSRWHITIALGLILFSLQVHAQNDPKTTLKDQPKSTQQKSTATKKTSEKSTIKPQERFNPVAAFKSIESAIRELAPKEDTEKSKRQNEREKGDLKAQQDMALWAKLMTLATAVGLILLWRTLYHTREAAKHAGDMVEEARKTTKAADRQANVSEEAYRNLDRPYVIETIVEYDVIKDGFVIWEPVVKMRFRNYGRTPAILIQIAAHLVVSVGPPEGDVLDPSHFANDILTPSDDEGKVIEVKADVLPQDEIDSIEDHGANVWLAGEFFYRDMQGQVYSRPFEWEYNLEGNRFFRRGNPKNKSKEHKKFKHHMPRSVKRDDRW